MFDKDYARYYELFNSDKPYENEIKLVYDLAERPKKILDIGCGTAHYWKYFPKETIIFGVEKSEYMARLARIKDAIEVIDITKRPIMLKPMDCVTALFDVLNYIPKHGWWKNLPLKKGGFYVFDVWNTEKVELEGFLPTVKKKDGVLRLIHPTRVDKKSVDLAVDIFDGKKIFHERHKMYLHSHEDIVKFCGKHFEVVDVKYTNTWQTFYKLRRK